MKMAYLVMADHSGVDPPTGHPMAHLMGEDLAQVTSEVAQVAPDGKTPPGSNRKTLPKNRQRQNIKLANRSNTPPTAAV